MSRLHSMKIEAGSEAEIYFMSILKKVDVKPNSVMCRLGSVFGTSYNEYILSDGLYTQISEFLEDSKEI